MMTGEIWRHTGCSAGVQEGSSTDRQYCPGQEEGRSGLRKMEQWDSLQAEKLGQRIMSYVVLVQ